MRLRQGYIKEGIGYIPLTQGKWALCDAHWFHTLSQFNWCAFKAKSNGRWYAQRGIRLSNGKTSVQLMHRLVAGVTDSNIWIDHKVRENTLDNRENNLRVATPAENSRHRGKKSTNTSGFIGVSWNKAAKKYRAMIGSSREYLGSFETAEDAAAVYNAAAKQQYGEFAVLNDLKEAQ